MFQSSPKSMCVFAVSSALCSGVLITACSSKDSAEKSLEANGDGVANKTPAGEATGATVSKPSQAAVRTAMLLFTAPDLDGRSTLFALDPNGGEPASVALPDDVDVAAASGLTSRTGAALAAFVSSAGGEETLRRFDLATLVDGAILASDIAADGFAANQVRALSEDGAVLVLQSGSDLVIHRSGKSATLKASADGRLVYGVAISADGTKLAYSTMQSKCAGSVETMGRCPVTLFAIDLADETMTPRRLAGGKNTVAYDPEFTSPTGETLWFMTNARDSNPKCKQSVNHCQFTVMEIPFAGGDATVRFESSILARRAPDGTASRKRLKSFMSPQELLIGNSVAPHMASHRLQVWSPDSRYVAANLVVDGQESLMIIDRKGKQAGNRVALRDARIVGWSQGKLPLGSRKVGEPRAHRALRHAVSVARRRFGTKTKLGVFGVPASVHDAVSTDAMFLKGNRVWDLLSKDKSAIGITTNREYCRTRMRMPSARADLTTPAYVILRATPAERKKPTYNSSASFPLDKARSVELMHSLVPSSATLGKSLPIELAWRSASAPPGWRVLVHLENKAVRLQADHGPPLCPADWGAKAIGHYTLEVFVPRNQPVGDYDVYVGWYRGAERAGERKKIGTVAIGK